MDHSTQSIPWTFRAATATASRPRHRPQNTRVSPMRQRFSRRPAGPPHWEVRRSLSQRRQPVRRGVFPICPPERAARGASPWPAAVASHSFSPRRTRRGSGLVTSGSTARVSLPPPPGGCRPDSSARAVRVQTRHPPWERSVPTPGGRQTGRPPAARHLVAEGDGSRLPQPRCGRLPGAPRGLGPGRGPDGRTGRERTSPASTLRASTDPRSAAAFALATRFLPA